MKMRPFSFSSHPKQADCLNKIDLFSPFSLLSVFITFSPLSPNFYASKKDLKHFRTLSPYFSLFYLRFFGGFFAGFVWEEIRGLKVDVQYVTSAMILPRDTSATGYFCEQKTIFVTPFIRLARVRITPKRPRAD